MSSSAATGGAVTAATAKQAQPRFKLYTVKDLEELPDPAWLLEDLLPEAGLAELYGPPGVGKSFLALDWGLSVAADMPWLGRPLSQGDVVYVSAEGGTGLKKRIAAWRTEHPEADLSRFRAILEPVNMLDPKDGKALVLAIKDVPCEPSFVVIDTLARCFGDGDENAAVDMNKFVKGTDLINGTFPQATLLVVHHTGKDPRRGDRGSTVLRAAADTMMELTGNSPKVLTLKCEKQKDWEPFDKINLRLQGVALGGGETSCVIAIAHSQPVPLEPVGNVSDAKAFKALGTFGAKGATFTDWLNASALQKSTFKIARTRLLRDGLVNHEGTLYRVTETNEGQGQGQGHPEF